MLCQIISKFAERRFKMQLILLSGGSGKRLWPLSNNARSKQFLSLLEREDGSMESMVQRVVRQIAEADIKADITLATNASQVDIISRQLGSGINIVVEPERRDTFAAIALAASYLSLERKVGDDEPVVVMPCDPYTGSEYFTLMGRMAGLAAKRTANLILMGIVPTYPSCKYGYISSGEEMSDGVFKVTRFIEKPSFDIAQRLIADGALWNSGVFAFNLGYMMDIVRKYVKVGSFKESIAAFSSFPQISFDYEVAEKEISIATVKCYCDWKDLGTWNTLTDELKNVSIGNAIVGPKCENTHVINELQHPIFVDGLKDVVVAASPDGILVCSKSRTENIKDFVEGMTSRPMYEERRWGTYRVIDDTVFSDGRHSLTKMLTIMPGMSISYQLHHHRSETWTFVEGEGLFVMDGNISSVKAGDTVVIPVEHLHTIKAVTELSFIEVQNGNPLVEEDIERFDWNWL